MLHSVPAKLLNTLAGRAPHDNGPAGATRDFRGYSPYSTNLFLRECVIFSVQCDIFSEHYAFKIVHYKYTTDKIFLIGQAVCRVDMCFFSFLCCRSRPAHTTDLQRTRRVLKSQWLCVMQAFRFGEAVLINRMTAMTHAGMGEDGKIVVLFGTSYAAHVEPQYLTRKIPWAQFYGGEVVEINGLPATVCGEEYPDGKFPVKFTGCGWHARVNPQHVQRVPRLA